MPIVSPMRPHSGGLVVHVHAPPVSGAGGWQYTVAGAGPGGPCSPRGPGSPGSPGGPAGPGSPGSPGSPGAPACPGWPCAPAEPEGPITPGGPGDPPGPDGPAGPCPPGFPGEPGAPGCPDCPGLPAGPGDGGDTAGVPPNCRTCSARTDRSSSARCSRSPSEFTALNNHHDNPTSTITATETPRLRRIPRARSAITGPRATRGRPG